MNNKLIYGVFGLAVSFALFAAATATAFAFSEVTGGLNARANTPPVSNDQFLVTRERAALSITLSATDVDGDDLTYSLVSVPSHGKLSGPVKQAAVPVFLYKPNKYFTGVDSFTFTARDADGGGTIGTITIAVRERVKPKLSAVSIASDNQNPALAKPGDTVTIQFTASEQIQTPAVTVEGSAAAVASSSAFAWTARYTMKPEDAEGRVRFNIAFRDLADNEGKSVAKTTDGSAVKFDASGPEISVSVSPKIISPVSRPKVKDSAHITAHLSEPSRVSVDIVNKAGVLVKNLYGSNDLVKNPGRLEWDGTNASGAFVGSGVYRIRVTASDAAGNASADSAVSLTVNK